MSEAIEPHPRGRWRRAGGRRARVGWVTGPLLFAAILALPAPEGLVEPARRSAAVAALMAAWWICEPIPLPATALLPLVLLPLLGVTGIDEAAAPFADPLIFLFLGGFLLALALERWSLHRRIALRIMAAIGTGRRRIVAGFMASGALLSMWMSNTATTLLLLPIGLSVLELVDEDATGREAADSDRDFAPALLLAIAFSASIGGVATLIGTPPNALTAAFLEETYGIEIGFAQWMLVGLPLMLVALPLAYLILTRLAFRIGTGELPGGRALVERERAALGPFSAAERRISVIFALTVAGWALRPVLEQWVPGISDAGIAVTAGLALFVIPVGREQDEPRDRRVFLLDWTWAERAPWGVLLLFGSGLSLAAAIDQSGLADWLASELEILGVAPIFALVLLVSAVVIFFSELASNTATAATFLPVVGALAVALGRDPVLLAVPAGLAASGGFMLPVATPPNAIVYGTGRIAVPQLVRAGALLDVVFVVLVPTVAVFLAPHLLS